jgi:putative nucleotidyltransferase with HDIG domain
MDKEMCTNIKVPKRRNMTKAFALRLLEDACLRNPGVWKEHSLYTGSIAKRIAQEIPGVDSDRCEINGYLHDIGRIKGISGIRHTIDGYHYLMEMGFPENARYCITHAFPGKRIIEHTKFDLTQDEKTFLLRFLDNIDYRIEDKILQCADFLASPFGPMVIEVRLVESALRNSVDVCVLEFWKECLKVSREIDRVINGSVYDLFEDVLTEWPK